MLQTLFRCLFCVFLPLFSGAQQYNFRNYTVKDGVAQSQVYSVIQDYRGYLWMGTRGGGLTRFDGTTFQTFSERDGLGSSYVNKIKEDRNHNLWIGTNKGLTYYDGRKFTNYIPQGYGQAVYVYDIAFDAQGRKWLATSAGVLLFEQGAFRSIARETGETAAIVTSVLIDSKQRIWYGTGKGLFRISAAGKGFKVRAMSAVSHYMGNAITTIAEDKKGTIWIGTYGDGAYRFDGTKYSRIDFHHELYKQTVLDILCDDDNNIWFATLTKGVVHYNTVGRTFSVLGEQEGLSNNHVRSIIRDNSGSMWFGTSGGGICHYFGKEFTTYDKSSGMNGSFIYSIFRDSRKRLWTGTSQKGLSVLTDGRFVTYSAANGFADVKVKAITEDRSGNVYFGTDGQGVFFFDGSTFKSIPGLSTCYIRGMACDRKGRIWIATAGSGLIELEVVGGRPQIARRILASDGLLNDRLSCLWLDKKDRLWYGTESYGVGLVKDGALIPAKLTLREGLLSNSIRCITEDKNGNLWIGTAGSGIAVVYPDGRTLKANSFDHRSGLTSANIYLLTFDEKNNLIVGTETGLDVVRYISPQSIKIVRHYGSGEGFTGIESCQNSVWNDPDGSIWFGTINGLSHYIPANASYNRFPPITTITDVKLFYQAISKTRFRDQAGDWNAVRHLDLPYDNNHLSFDFLAINFSNPQGVKYRWKLVGFDEQWSPVTSEHTITYSNLNPGKYTFLVKAMNEDGVWNRRPVAVTIDIAAPFWYQWWFITLVIGLFAGLLYAVFAWQTNRIRTKAFEEQRKLQLEKEVVELEQKALRLQMNPHFIFNALNSIQSLIGTGNEKEARYYLAKFSRLMRQILDNSRNTLISLDEEVLTLENYLLVEQFCSGNRFGYTILLDPEIERDFIKLPPMLLQPFVENAIKHGFRFDESHAGKRGKIEISFTDLGQVLECRVTDNGIGRKKAAELNAGSMETYHHSTALLVTQERLDLMPEQVTQQSLEILDFTDENGEAAGTTVIIRIPIT